MKRLNGAGTRALDVVKQFTVAQRTIAIIGVAVLALGAIALSTYLGKPTYQVLYSNISQANASSVVAQLDKDKVDYQLSDGGQTILVPASAVDAERLATASLLSSGAGGYSLLDNMGVTASEFQQNVTYKRAIEGELAKTIESIDGVSSSSVQLAIPQQSVFTEEKEDPTASVFVNAATPLGSDQVGAIVHLVAAAYPGLTTDNVSVVDQKGDTLSAVGGGSTSGSDSAADYETSTKAAVQAMLDKVLGPGNAVVTVAADVSSSSGTKRSTTYNAAGKTPLTESSNSTSYANGGAAVAGATGASGVLGTDTTDTSTGGNSASGSGGVAQLLAVAGLQEQRRRHDGDERDDRPRHAEPADHRGRGERGRLRRDLDQRPPGHGLQRGRREHRPRRHRLRHLGRVLERRREDRRRRRSSSRRPRRAPTR